jgi:ABC-2 type transport system permease protein
MMEQLRTVGVFVKVNTLRFFRDPLALFFTVAFPLIFLFVFGGLFGNSGGVSLKVALINQSGTQFANNFVDETKKSNVLKLNQDITTVESAKERMNRGELDATVILPADFGAVKDGQQYPSGEATVLYTQNNQQAGQALGAIMDSIFKGINQQFVKTETPFTVKTEQTNDHALSSFDYTFSGLLGFSIIGLGIFGPINVFPELKKQGILRRLSTTPLKVWQFFLSNMITQAIVGLFTMVVMFAVAVMVFHLNIVGNVFEIGLYIAFGIVTILGIGLALGGWAKNERQVAPLANLVTFPMMFLSGTFFPRFLMPEWLQTASSFLPLTPVVDGIRLMLTEGKHLVDLAPQLGMMGVWTLVIYVVAFRVFRWE